MASGTVDFLKKYYSYFFLRLKYRNKNVVFRGVPVLNKKVTFEGHNAIYPGATIKNSFVGQGTYIGSNTKLSNTRIGRFCTIADNVRISLGRHPSDTFVSIHPAFFSTQKQGGFTFVNQSKYAEHITANNSKYFVEIGNDVWIGNNVVILDGITIGDGAIVAAGAIVTKDVAPYSIVGGLPAKLIKWRFSPGEIEQLQYIKWWEKDIDWLRRNAAEFENIGRFLTSVA